MALRMVNAVPGDVNEPMKPGEDLHFAFKSETQEVLPSSIGLHLGISNIAHRGTLPETDGYLREKGLDVRIETSERRRPKTSTAMTSMNPLRISRETGAWSEASVYEMELPIAPRAGVLAYVRVRKSDAWGFETPADWMWTGAVAPLLFGLEYGPLNTGAFVALLGLNHDPDPLIGSVVMGGPLQALSTPRPAQTEKLFPWLGVPDGGSIELLLRFDPSQEPFQVELWGRAGAGALQRLITLPTGALGTFPSSLFPNQRPGPSATATLYIGNLGAADETLMIEDWALFPDFRTAVCESTALPHHRLALHPDLPIRFDATRGQLPEALRPGRWIPVLEGGLLMDAAFHYQPGRRNVPRYLLMRKRGAGRMAYQKQEPRLEPGPLSRDGFMVEALMSGTVLLRSTDSNGMGFLVDDGERSYRVLMLDDTAQRTIGIQKNVSLANSLPGHWIPTTPVDFLTPRLVRLVADRHRGKLELVVDEEKVLSLPFSCELPAAVDSLGRVQVGHVFSTGSEADFQLGFLSYLSRYLAWEGGDGLYPNDPALSPEIQFVLSSGGEGASTLEDGGLTLSKRAYNAEGSRRFYSRPVAFREVGGLQVDFRAQVLRYADENGEQDAPHASVGAGLKLFFGNHVLYLGFYDCGTHGRRVGILPGQGRASDIIQQTELGRRYSGKIDWTKDVPYRLVVKAYDRISLWAGSILDAPLIEIPWNRITDSFDLPQDFSDPGLAFGHFEGSYSSETWWGCIRWGLSNGYEISLAQAYPEGLGPHVFGGRTLLLTEFEEG
jgi:hypothetical protein